MMHIALVKLLYDATMKSRTSLRALIRLFTVMQHHTDENDNDDAHDEDCNFFDQDDYYDSSHV